MKGPWTACACWAGMLLGIWLLACPTPPDGVCSNDDDCHAVRYCEPSTGTCQPRNKRPLDAASSSSGSGGGASSSSGGDAGTPAISVANLHAPWSTPNTIFWRWERSGDVLDFLAYELVVAQSEADVTSRSGTAVVVTSEQNPELGVFDLARTGGIDPVLATMTAGLEPDTRYHAQLVAIDALGRRFHSNIASRSTTVDWIHQAVIYEDTPTAGYSLPAAFTHTTGPSLCGTQAYEYVVDCPDGGRVCFENLRRQNLNILDLGSRINAGNFNTTAYVELAVHYQGNGATYWSDLRFGFDEAGTTRWYHLRPVTIPGDGQWRTYQIPLRVLEDGMNTLQYAELANEFYEFSVGGGWADEGRVRVDCVRIRW